MRKLLFLLFFIPAAAFAQLPSITTATVVKLQKGDVTWLCRLDSLAEFLAIGGTDNNGIYSGSGTIAPGAEATVSTGSVFSIKHDNGKIGLSVDSDNDVTVVGEPSGTNGFAVFDIGSVAMYVDTADITLLNTSASIKAPYTIFYGNTTAGELRFSEKLSSPGDEYTGFRAPDSLVSSVMYTLPTAAGTDGQQLTWNTGSVLTWADAGGSVNWGSIGGTLSDQTDLNSALAGKAPTAHTHALSDLTQSGATTNQVPRWDGSAWVPTSIGVTGSGTNGQVTYWNSSSTITSGANFTFNGTNIGIGGAVNSDHQLYLHGTNAMKIPSGTTAERPGIPVAGSLRLNTTVNTMEFYDGSDWQGAGGGGSGESNTASNVGSGAGWYKQKTGVDLEFKTIVAGGGISVANNTSDLTVSTTAPQPASSETIEASNFTATMRRINLVDCSAAPRTVTPPSSPAIGDRFAVVDAEATAATNNITIDFDTANQKLYAVEQNYIINVAGGYVEFIYMGTTTGWVATKG